MVSREDPARWSTSTWSTYLHRTTIERAREPVPVQPPGARPATRTLAVFARGLPHVRWGRGGSGPLVALRLLVMVRPVTPRGTREWTIRKQPSSPYERRDEKQTLLSPDQARRLSQGTPARNAPASAPSSPGAGAAREPKWAFKRGSSTVRSQSPLVLLSQAVTAVSEPAPRCRRA